MRSIKGKWLSIPAGLVGVIAIATVANAGSKSAYYMGKIDQDWGARSVAPKSTERLVDLKGDQQFRICYIGGRQVTLEYGEKRTELGEGDCIDVDAAVIDVRNQTEEEAELIWHQGRKPDLTPP